MKSRYSAYTLGLSDYIIQTTHPENETFTHDYTTWKASITDFCQHTEFLGLTITSFQDGEEIAYVNFIASLSSGPLKEHSKFVKVNGRWLYHSGTVELSEG
jgi:SEC-C motif-containing protein